MGFATYYGAAYGRYYPTQQVFQNLSDDMVRVGMTQAGYRVFAMEGWRFASQDAQGNYIAATARAADGSLVPRPEFPDMAALARHVHANGQLAGIYTDAGKSGCYGPYAGSGDHIRQDLAQFLAWGYDYLKLDHCGGNPNSGALGMSGSLAEYSLWSQAIQDLALSAGRPFIFNIADWNDDRTPGWGFRIGNSWRTATDIDCYFGCNITVSWQTILRNFDKNDVPPAAGAGHWNDPDYLLIGMRLPDGSDPLTRTEEKSYFSMWAIQAAPLMLATYPADLDPALPSAQSLREIVFNSEVIAVNQDSLGRQAEKVREDVPGLQVFSKVLAQSGTRAVLLLNRGEAPATIRVDWGDLGLARGAAQVRDLWTHQELGTLSGGYTAAGVLAHGVVMLKVSGTEQVVAAPAGWEPLGDKILGAPSAFWTPDGQLTVLARGLDSYVHVRHFAGGQADAWGPLNLPPLPVAPAFATEKNPVDLEVRGEPSVVARGNEVHLVAQGVSTPYAKPGEVTVWHSYSPDGGRTWTTPEDLGGGVFGRVSAIYRDNANFDVLGRGGDGALWRKTYTWGAGWSGWTSLGACLHSGVALAGVIDGIVHLAAVGCDDAIWHGYYLGDGAVNWERVGEALSVSETPAIVIDPVTRLVSIFARSLDGGQVEQTTWNGGWSSWQPLGACVKSGIFAAPRPEGWATSGASVDLFSTGCNSAGKISQEDALADSVVHRVR